MYELPSILLLIGQAMLTIIAVEQMRRRVFVSLHRFNQPALIMDVWGPLALIIPMLFFVRRVGDSVHGVGWMTFGGPVMCGLIAMGSASVAAPGGVRLHQQHHLIAPRAIAVWTGAGVVLLLLGAAHDLTLWMGQCAFAVAAVLLWINTPDDPPSYQPTLSDEQLRAGFGMTIALACAVGQGLISMNVADEYANISGGLMLAGAAIAVASAARLAGAVAAIRIGGWAAAYGILLSLGLLSVQRMMPELLRMLRTGATEPLNRIAYGFGAYWIEALAVLSLAGVAIAVMRMNSVARKIIGITLIIAASILAAWRLATM